MSCACEPSEARAAEMMPGFKPRRCAMLMPADAPGTPSFSSYVGWSVASSKPTAALSTPGVFVAYTFSEV